MESYGGLVLEYKQKRLLKANRDRLVEKDERQNYYKSNMRGK